MDFTFLHAADLHLGSPFRGLSLKDPAIAARFAAAGREAFTGLVDAAIEARVAFVVIAGDVYDGEWKDSAVGLFFARECARLDRAGIPVFLLRGNHDAESVVTRSIGLPGNVRVFSTRTPETHRLEGLRVALHGRSFPDRAVGENLAASYPAALAGWFNIGVLHSSLDGRPGHATYAPCSIGDLKSRGYDYWALGHIHAREIVDRDPWIVFPGNIQGRSPRETGAKGAVLVDVVEGRVAEVRPIIADRARWAEVTVDLAAARDEFEAYARIETALAKPVGAAEGRLVALRLRLTGGTAAHPRLAADPERLRDEVQAAAQRVHEDVWLERVVLDSFDPQAAAPGAGIVGLGDLIAGIGADPAYREALGREIALVQSKMPATPEGAVPLEAEMDRLIAEAAALVRGRTERPGN